MTTVQRTSTGSAVTPVLRTTAAVGAGVLALGAVLRWAEAARTGDDEYLTSDLVGIGVMAVVGLVVIGAVDVWALRGGPVRVRRTVVGLAVAAVLVLPVMWWNAVPVMLAASVLALSARVGRDVAPRAAVVAAVLVVAVVVAVWCGSVLAVHL